MADLEDSTQEAEIPESEEQVTPAVEPDADVPSDEVEAKAETEDEEAPEEKPKRRQRSENYRELRAERDALRKLVELQQQQPTSAARQESQTDEAPKRDSFDDYEEYLEARAAYAARQQFQGIAQQYEQQRRQDEAARTHAEQNSRWEQSHESAVDRYDDYEELMEVVGTSIEDHHAEAIRESDDPAEIVYYLGKHPKEFAKFKALPPRKAALAVGRYEATIQSAKAQQSKAPKPVSPVRSGAQSSNRLSDDLPIDQWMKLRNKQAMEG